MRMPLYVVSPGAHVGIQNGRIVISYPKNLSQSKTFPLRRVSSIFLYGPSTFTHHALENVLQLGIGVVFFSAAGRFIGRIAPPALEAGTLRSSYFKLFDDEHIVRRFAKSFLVKKLEASLYLEKLIAKNLSLDAKTKIETKISSLASTIAKLEVESPDLFVLRGLEGDAAKRHFEVLNSGIKRNKFAFNINNRNRRPPKDPVNSLLSFLYSLLLGEIVGAIVDRGLCLSQGFLHSSHTRSKPLLAFDLMEGFRSSLAERLMLRLINLEQIKPSHFENKGGGTYLTQEGRRIVAKEWLNWMEGKSNAACHNRRKAIWNAAQNLRNDLENSMCHIG